MDIQQTIPGLIHYHAENNPSHVAIIDGNISYTYNELNQKANQLAHYLQPFIQYPEMVIAICLPRSAPSLIAMLATLKLGCTYLPLDANQPEDRLQYILTDAKARILMTQSQEKFTHFSGKIFLIDEWLREIDVLPKDGISFCYPESLAYIIYTSGSTGKPKGVMVEHKSIVNYTQWFANYTECAAQDRIDYSSHVMFDMGLTTSMAALALGLQVVICSDEMKKNVDKYLSFLQTHQINISKMTPSFFKILLQEALYQKVDLSNLKKLILGGEILHTKDGESWLKQYPTHILFNEYGPTETTVGVTSYRLTKENIKELGDIVPIGKPGHNMNCKLVRDGAAIGESDIAGELFISGICLSRGYVNAASGDKQIDGTRWYKTGDLCQYTTDKNLAFIKRIDGQVKIRGYRVEPSEIETCLRSHPLIKETAVTTNGNSSDNLKLIAYYIPLEKKQLKREEIQQFLRQKLPDYMIPTSFIPLKAFPLTENGKLDKKKLLNPESQHIILGPVTKTQSILIGIWQQIFQIKEVGLNSNFFALGGHSLIAARMLLTIEKKLRKRIDFTDLYHSPKLHELADLLDARKKSVTRRRQILMKTRKNIVPLSDFQFVFWISSLFAPNIKKLNIAEKKRFSGSLDIHILNQALNWLVKNHEILSYKVSKIAPLQYRHKTQVCPVAEYDLRNCSESETEIKLTESFNEFINYAEWKNHYALIRVNLFQLANQKSEVQVCLPHIICDNVAIKIIFSELSAAYLHFKNNAEPLHHRIFNYKDYIFYEKKLTNETWKEKINFWDRYLQHTHFLKLPKDAIIPDMGGISYSSYLDLPFTLTESIKNTSANHLVSTTDLIFSAIAMACKEISNNTGEKTSNNTYFHLVRSNRASEFSDKMVGCILRVDAIKININETLSLIELAKKIEQTRIKIEPFQQCSGLIKLASLNHEYKMTGINHFIAKQITKFYAWIFKKGEINPHYLAMCARLSSLRKKQMTDHQFLVNINLLTDFSETQEEKGLFGLHAERNNVYHFDLSTTNNILDISLIKDQFENSFKLVISGNLKESFRKHIGEKIIEVLDNVK